jgi:hypothetical protein
MLRCLTTDVTVLMDVLDHIHNEFPFPDGVLALKQKWSLLKLLDLNQIFFRSSLREVFHQTTSTKTLLQSLDSKYVLATSPQYSVLRVKWKTLIFPLVIASDNTIVLMDRKRRSRFATITALEYTLDFDGVHRWSTLDILNGTYHFTGTFLLSLIQRLDYLFNIRIASVQDASRFEEVSTRFIQTVQDKIWFYTSKGGYQPLLCCDLKLNVRDRRSQTERIQNMIRKANYQLTLLYQHPLLQRIRLHQRQHPKLDWKRLYSTYEKEWEQLCKKQFAFEMIKLYPGK